MDTPVFPLPLESYADAGAGSLLELLHGRIVVEPFNLVATTIFVAAIVHTFLTGKFRQWAHEAEERHAAKLKAQRKKRDGDRDGRPEVVSFRGQVLHFLGEVEAVFGIWAILLAVAIAAQKGWATMVDYVGHRVNFVEPIFVVVIMALASTRPVLRFAEHCLRSVAAIGRGSVAAWWLALLIIAPLMGSFITEPAAMTITALLLGRQFYELKPSPRFAYATLGLLFVNISVGGTLTHFAAPPVLMVAAHWKWDFAFMFMHFGWRSAIGIVASTAIYYVIFRKEFAALEAARSSPKPVYGQANRASDAPVPIWITCVQLGFMAWTVFVAHYPVLFVGSFLVFLAFHQATAHHQSPVDLKPPLLVGFFLAGLVIHGGLQGWWIGPILRNLSVKPLFLGATALTAFNDNAAITYLSTLVPNFSDAAKYAVVAGAVTGGGLTVIANAPNPAGQSILQRYFPDGISPLGLLLGAALPTVILSLVFLFV
jgi:hypothetical protein